MVLELHTKQLLAQRALTLGRSYSLVRYRSHLYIPSDFETGDIDVTPDPVRTVWRPLPREDLRRMAAEKFDILFATDGELNSFMFMTGQAATYVDKAVSSLLVRTEHGLKVLDDQGDLVDPDGEFRPNALVPMLNEDKDDKERVFQWLVEILDDSEEEAESLLRHLATSLAPGWSAGKYILLLGGGANGKSLLLRMVLGLFGHANASSVTRQDMAERSPVVTDLNGRLLNVIFDGPAEFLRDSGNEKSLVMGEPLTIRRLYESDPTTVQTTALFLEGLNKEPKTSDKSSALQRRLVRFSFPKVFDQDLTFEDAMLTPATLGAFMSLLIDRYVQRDALAVALAPTAKSIELKLEQMYVNSMGLQYLKHLEESPATSAVDLLGEPLSDLVDGFRRWRLKENDLGTWGEPDVQALFNPLVVTERKSARTADGVRKIRVVVSFKTEATAFLNSLKGDVNDEHELLAAVVED